MRTQWQRSRPPASAWTVVWALLCLTLSTGLAACGATPGASLAGATATPSGPGAAPGVVRLVWSQSRYGPMDTLRLTIANGLSASVYVRTNHADCEAVTLERLVGATWENAAGCGGAFPKPEIVEIASGGSLEQVLAPGAGGGPAGKGGAGGSGGTWPAGTYRATLQYVTSQTAPEAQGITLISASIVVG